MFDLTGKTALVTGAGRGIGAEIAATLARQGARVAVNDLLAETASEQTERIRSAGGQAAACPFDVTDYQGAEAAIRAAETELGEIDILVNNAGGSPNAMHPTPFLKTPRACWPDFMGMNLDGTLICSRIVAEGMAQRGYGRLVAVSSDAARLGSYGSSIYGAAKAGAEGLMRTLSKELGAKGVTANSVVLGLIDTVPKEYLDGLNADSAYVTQRIGTAQDVAAGVLYLVSEEAGWVSGHSLVINGGGTL